MLINKKVLITLSLASVVTVVALTSMTPPPDKDGFTNLKVLPKKISGQELHKVMHEWSASLSVHCDFCHAANADGKGLDFASDAKPEKESARYMYKMMNKINEKYFQAKKDSTGMMMTTGVNCYTCHHGNSHPDIKIPEGNHGPGGPPPGAPGGPGPGGPPPGGGPDGNHN